MSEQLTLFQDGLNQWEKTTKSMSTRDADFDTLSGKELDLCYFPDSPNSDYMDKIGFPGQFPYTRGVHPNLYRGQLWTMRQFAGFGKP